MTIMDGLLLFSSAQAITVTAVSSNVIDLLNAREMGVGDDPALKIMCYVTTAFIASTDSGVLTIQAQGSTDNSTFTTYAESRGYSAADLTIGSKLFPIDWPHRTIIAGLGTDALPRYIALNYQVASSAGTAAHFTTGKLTAALVLDRQDAGQYAPGIGISN